MKARDWALLCWSTVLALAILGPLARAGRYLLLRDAVSTPRSYVTDAALGLGENAARATPQDWLVAVASRFVDGGYLVTALLLVFLMAAGWGFGRAAAAVLDAVGVTDGVGAGPCLAAATVAVWNPYVAERLLQGHWSLLAGYAAVGWMVVAALTLTGRRQVGAFAAAMAAGGLTPTGAVFALVAGLVVAPRRWIVLLGTFVLVAAPWLYASVVAGGGTRADPFSVSAFAARAEPGLGTVGSLLGLGGIWNRQAVPPGLPWLWTVLIAATICVGALALRRALLRPPLGRLALLAAAAVLLPALAATAPGRAVLEAVVQTVPGSGLLRDGQKWVALAVPVVAVCAAAAVAALPVAARPFGVLVGLVLPIAVLPALAWGVSGALAPTTYPQSWRTAAATIDPGHGSVAVLPAGMFRRFAYGPPVAVLDPAPRMLRAPVLQTGELRIGGVSVDRVPGVATRAEQVLADGGPLLATRLAELGVGWVLVEAVVIDGAQGFPQVPLPGLELALDTPELRVYRVPGDRVGAGDPVEVPGWERTGAVAAHVVWLAVLGLGAATALAARRRDREMSR